MSCFVFGDCLALGLAAVLGGCGSSAKVGIPSADVILRAPPAYYDFVAISTGSNDPHNPRLSANLRAIRMRIHAGRIIWVLPINRTARKAVLYVARKHGDGTVHVSPGRDNVHPKSYRALAAAVLKAGGS